MIPGADRSMYSRARMRIGAAIAAAMALASVSQAALAEKRSFSIQSQDASSALMEFGRQAGLQILFAYERVKGATTNAVDGDYEPIDAVRLLIKDTGLRVVKRADGVLVVEHSNDRSSATPQTADDADRDATVSRIAVADGPSTLAQASRSTELDDRTSSRSTSDTGRIEVEEIVVVGSRLGSATTQSAQPVIVVTRNEIERSGASTIAQVMNALPEVSVSSGGTNPNQGHGVSTPQLRGLPRGTTLTLINGRRIGHSGPQAANFGGFDINTIPLEAVERIEVLPAGSSAVYGGDALGGVINVVLDRTFSGLVANARYGGADGYDETQGHLAWGHAGPRGSAVVAATYATNSELTGAERAITADQDYRRFGGPDRTVTTANPGNVYSAGTANLPGLSSTFAAIPAGASGVGMTPTQFAATAGTLNRFSRESLASFVGEQDRVGLSMFGTLALTDETELFVEALYSNNDSVGCTAPGSLSRQLVPALNPFNPFGQAVRVDFQFDDAYRQCNDTSTDYLRSLLGARGAFASWKWELAGWTSRSTAERVDTKVVNPAAVSLALASADPSTALNVFQDGPGGTAALIDSLLMQRVHKYQTALRSASGVIRGPLFELPSGAVEFAFGGEFEGEVLDIHLSDTPRVDVDRESYALFSEVKIPLWEISSGGASRDLIVLSGAARYDHYSDFGSRTSPGAGIEIRPLDSLLVRASYSSAFKPAVLYQLYQGTSVIPSSISDPQLGGITYTVNGLFGGNPDLEPYTGTSRTLGLVFSPPAGPDLEVALTHWEIELKNGFVVPTPQFVVDHPELYPGRVTRDPVTGRVTSLDRSFVNFGYIDEAGIDLRVDWRVQTSVGEFVPSLAATHTYEYESQVVTNGVTTSNVSAANINGFAPRWKGAVGLGWNVGRAQTTLIGRYTGEYRDYTRLPDGRFLTLGNLWYLDTNLRIELGSLISRGPNADTTYLAVGALNLFDKLPDYSNSSAGYDPQQYDLFGRMLYAKLGVQF